MDVRLDKWLWAVRVFKTRSAASQACRNGKVSISGHAAKPSRIIKLGEEVAVRQRYITRTFRVMGLAQKRVSAKTAPELVEETTPAGELAKLQRIRKDPLSEIFAHRGRGGGRPTKKERRDLERLKDSSED
jgi:ribosome-associated heat shock protein Hsp15